ncbi:hypothetical protein [Candidatus Uabimicrobium amorphum]|uniref:hypothetical protein n=1 Tax=Uabimicrobium amorphum TaxID=2596890 RepID=UPI00125F49DD|nr:hypothetical protein [Candidatus Uabimicrobium amorphum]
MNTSKLPFMTRRELRLRKRYLHQNHREDVVGITDIGGNVVYRFEYSTYVEIFEVNSANELDEFTDFEEIVYGF